MQKSFLTYIYLFLFSSLVYACGGNLFESMIEPGNDAARLDEAASLIDEKKYADALTVLAEVEGNSNRRRTLEAAAYLGEAEVGIWDIIGNVLESSEQSNKTINFDSIFDSISGAFFGTGDERTVKITAMQNSINALLAAPEPDDRRTKNVSCFIGSILTVLTVGDGNQAIADLSQALTTLQSSSTGSGSTDEECPGVDDLATSLERINQVRVSLELILSATEGCGFIDLGANSPNQVEQKLNQLVTRADLGCQEVPDCGASEACQALSLGCVQSRIDFTEAVASDSQLASCELVQNCIGADCFGTSP
ncbi:MAG: hypothetical protein ACOH5I_18640 [Oligoflexus sp.]